MTISLLETNQRNKQSIWQFWLALADAADSDLAALIDGAAAGDARWFGPAPIDQMPSNAVYLRHYLLPLRRSFPNLTRHTHIFMAGESNGKADGAEDGRLWVGGTGLLTGVFEWDFLGIPATVGRVSIRWSEFFLMEDGRIAESYFLLDLVDLMQQAGVHALPQARGRDHVYPAPGGGDAVFLAPQDADATGQSMALIRAFLFDSLNSYDQKDLSSMGVADYFSKQVRWYGPGGIGACLNLREFERLHQQPWLTAFPDRKVQDLDSLFAEGNFAASSGWGAVSATHAGPYLGCPATGNEITTNGIDFWRRQDNRYVENWVFVDMIHLFRQFGVDLLAKVSL
ncbi:MAG: ester cyclase [Gammaproteobacteria bacterium]|nr:ester cyclase [Gammaproteobacteria bacterium]MDD9962701.1 ester cyclase [Gammaproteobacteria bacterium]MDE0273480.1 ester cyclase [Gammaproteobacteria bacterium]